MIGQVQERISFRPSEGEQIAKRDESGKWVLLVDPSKVSPALLRMLQRDPSRTSPETGQALLESR